MNEQTEKNAPDLVEACGEINRFMHQSFATFLKSAEAMSRGWEEVARSTSGLMQEHMSRALTTGKSIMEANSLEDVMNVQRDFLKDSFSCALNGHDKISEVSTRTTKEAVQPAVDHATESVNRFTQKTRENEAA